LTFFWIFYNFLHIFEVHSFLIGGLCNFAGIPLELFKSFQSALVSSGKKGRDIAGQILARGAAGGGEGVDSEHQELKAHLLGVLGRGGDDRRWGSHGGRGSGGEELVVERVPASKWGNAPVQKLQQEERKLLVRLNWTEKERREGFDGDRSSAERRGTTPRWFRWKSGQEEWPGSVSEVRGSSPGGRSGQWKADSGGPRRI
jgi:hypothetical protein